MVSFLNDVDVADLVPPILRNYTSRVQMVLSNLQILESTSELVLNTVLSEIRKRTGVVKFPTLHAISLAPPVRVTFVYCANPAAPLPQISSFLSEISC